MPTSKSTDAGIINRISQFIKNGTGECQEVVLLQRELEKHYPDIADLLVLNFDLQRRLYKDESEANLNGTIQGIISLYQSKLKPSENSICRQYWPHALMCALAILTIILMFVLNGCSWLAVVAGLFIALFILLVALSSKVEAT